MTLYKLILLQLSAHLIADYIFQPQKWTREKERAVFTFYHFYHVLVVFMFSYLLSFDLQFWFAAYVLTLMHLLTDMLKTFLQLRNQRKVYRKEEEGILVKPKNYFFLDQLIHLISLVVICYLYDKYFGIQFVYEFPLKVLAIITAFIFCAKPANIIIKFTLVYFGVEIPKSSTNMYDVAIENEQSVPNAGKLIGVMERFLTLALILIGQFSAVGLIIAAKSILRFRSTQRNEYILVGTLLSFGIAVLLGIAVKTFLK